MSAAKSCLKKIESLRRKIRKVSSLEAEIEKLYNEIFSPELWRAKESMRFARIALEAELKRQVDSDAEIKGTFTEFTQNP